MFAHEDKINANNNTRRQSGKFTSRDFELFLIENFQFIGLFLDEHSEIFSGISSTIENLALAEFFGNELGLPGHA
jgi:hypothetical protein|tara:strand:+ start:353 stop:577 length:225 start_codon:yes stop_codon:yes gene_type:complete